MGSLKTRSLILFKIRLIFFFPVMNFQNIRADFTSQCSEREMEMQEATMKDFWRMNLMFSYKETLHKGMVVFVVVFLFTDLSSPMSFLDIFRKCGFVYTHLLILLLI